MKTSNYEPTAFPLQFSFDNEEPRAYSSQQSWAEVLKGWGIDNPEPIDIGPWENPGIELGGIIIFRPEPDIDIGYEWNIDMAREIVARLRADFELGNFNREPSIIIGHRDSLPYFDLDKSGMIRGVDPDSHFFPRPIDAEFNWTNLDEFSAFARAYTGFDRASITYAQKDIFGLNGNSGDDLLVGRAYGDRLVGGDGADLLYGGRGNDYLLGGDGNDKLFGGPDHDVLVGGDGHDILEGGQGNDTIYGMKGDDKLYGEQGNDKLYGGLGNDVLNGGKGDDVLNGEQGHDKLWGGRGDDLLQGGDGNDYLAGGSGNDWLVGGRGNDTLVIGAGHDELVGGSGKDKFILDLSSNATMHSQIHDFNVTDDTLVFSNADNEPLAPVLSSSANGSLVASFGENKTIDFTNIDYNSAHNNLEAYGIHTTLDDTSLI